MIKKITIILILIALCPIGLYSYVLMGVKWPSSPLGPLSAANMTPVIFAVDGSARLTLGVQYENLIINSARTWNGTSNARLLLPAEIDPLLNPIPQVVVSVTRDQSIYNFVSYNTLGVTNVLRSGGNISAAPIIIIDVPSGAPTVSRYATNPDLFKAVVAHEFGHSVGLNHPPSSDALMYAFANQNIQVPQADDINGIRALYGYIPPPPTIEEAIANFCSAFSLDPQSPACLYFICLLSGFCKL